MRARNVKRLVVTDADGRLRGIASRTDTKLARSRVHRTHPLSAEPFRP
jgi:predicted transcriptional regulator